jgi:hypothetical protein
MKQCPQCRNTYADDHLFCLDDGAALEFAPDFADGSFSGEAPTVAVPNYSTPAVSPAVIPAVTPPATPAVSPQGQNKWTYPVIGVLAGLVVVFGFLTFYKLNSGEKPVETATVKEDANKAAPAPTPFETPAQMPVQPPRAARLPAVNAVSLPGRFPEASTRILTTNDLYGKTNWDMRIMRNEIFARYGYVFKNTELRNYFMNQPWYRPQYDNVEGFLNEVEKRNAVFLKSYE